MITNINDLYSLIARQNEVIKRVKNGGLSIEAALSGTQGILDGNYPLIQDKFAQFAHLLRSLEEQAIELRRLNKQMPKKMQVPDSWFDNLDTVSDHIQLIEDLEFFFIVPPGTLKKVVEYQLKLMELTQPGIWLFSDFEEDTKNLSLDSTADAEMYAKPGIYRLRINLVSYWDPKNGSSVDKAREQATAAGVKLAGLPAVGAYAAQKPELYQSQDGENLPYFDIADLRSGDDGSRALYSGWRRNDREAYFGSYGSDRVDRRYARPSFV
ncbi:MAG: hypothetical protein WCP11_03430 [Candidatus Saccharibacteria bacterium]